MGPDSPERVPQPAPGNDRLGNADSGEAAEYSSEERFFPRLSLTIRMQHIVLMVSCVLLIVSGLPLRYPDSSFAEFLFRLTGGVGLAGFIHRLGAVGLIGVGLFHMGYVMVAGEGRREFSQLLPRLGDFRDLAQNMAHFFDFRSARARFGRWGYIQKFDYWAVYWGMVVMITTGLLLWFQNTAMIVFPKFALDVAREAHSDEALLATLAIIVWHMYNVHLNPSYFPMNRAWLTGNISEGELRKEHPLEYERMVAEGVTPQIMPKRPPKRLVRRRRPFTSAWAVAPILIVVALVNLVLWLTFRSTHKQGPKPPPAATAATQPGTAPESAASTEVPPGRVHPADWIKTHPPKTAEAVQRCHTCHEPSFCVACHQTARPSNHGEPNWPSHHAWAVAQTGRNCETCHRSGFCLSCHKTHSPSSHQQGWAKAHGEDSMIKGANCTLCHDREYCAKCHGGVAMPHPDTFTIKHRPLAKQNDQPCLKCHQRSECSVCHRGTRPESHNADWTKRHGQWASAKKQDCSLCHSAGLCSSCHRGVDMPHPRDWTEEKHQPVAKKDQSSCLACHKQNDCLKCHGLAMPHPADFAVAHNKVASFKSDSACFRCHTREKTCNACHPQ